MRAQPRQAALKVLYFKLGPAHVCARSLRGRPLRTGLQSAAPVWPLRQSARTSAASRLKRSAAAVQAGAVALLAMMIASNFVTSWYVRLYLHANQSQSPPSNRLKKLRLLPASHSWSRVFGLLPTADGRDLCHPL